MVKRSGNGDVDGLWLKGQGPSVGPEALRVSSRIHRAAASLQLQSHGAVVASCGLPLLLCVSMRRSVYARALVATPPTPRRAALRGASPSSCHSAALGLRGVSGAT